MTPAVLHILLSLSAEDRHGLGIAADVREFSSGKLSLGPGTLYGTLNRLLDAGRALELETTDLASILTVAKRRRVLKTS